MRKLCVLAWKEVRLAFRDVGAIVTMLVTPLVLTLVIGAAFGGGGALSDIPVLLLDLDEGNFSEELLTVFELEDVRDLVALEIVFDEGVARKRVEADEVAALVIIPADFSDRVLPLASEVQRRVGLDLFSLRPGDELTQEQQKGIVESYLASQEAPTEPTTIEIYASPDWQISTNVVKSVVQQGLEILNMRVQGLSVVVSRVIADQTQAGNLSDDETGWMTIDEDALFGEGALAGETTVGDLPIEVTTISGSGRSFTWISYTATAMSVLFLMFAVTSGGRTLLAERTAGTLPRLLVSPTPALTILVGKMGGIVLTGSLQMVVLWAATSLLGAYWGSPPEVLLTILLLVVAASGVGALISAWARTAGQAGAIGTAVTLVGSALSGTFFPREGLPEWVQTFSLITPNAWGIELFSRLQMGGRLGDVLSMLGGVVLLTMLYYGAALVGFRRQFD
ncbi:MAG: ABC transporter permease [Anaerolineae bacterium]